MNKPIELRFIPKWLNGAIMHYQSNYNNFESIVSRHDVEMYRVANNHMQTTLKRHLISDFVLPAAELTKAFSEDDALFALFGNNPNELTVPEFDLKRFVIIPDAYDGILIIEKDEDNEEKSLVGELLLALALYRGKEQAYGSTTFKRYLTLVNKNTQPVLSPKGAIRFQEALKMKIAANAAANAAELAKEDL